MKLIETESGFVFQRGAGCGVVIFLALPLLIAGKALVAGYVFDYLWTGFLGAIFCVFVFFRLSRFFSRTKVHYLSVSRAGGLLECGLIDNGEDIPLWEVDLADLGGVAIMQKPAEEQRLFTLVGLMSQSDGQQVLVDLLPFTQEFRRSLRRLEEHFHLAGVSPLSSESIQGIPYQEAPWYVPEY